MRNTEYDKTMVLVSDLTAALEATRDTLEKCQAENKLLTDRLKECKKVFDYYGNRQNYQTREVNMDCGSNARDIIEKIEEVIHGKARLS